MADIITYPENGITYDADDASGYLATRLSGVYSAEEDFSVTAQGGLNVQVSAGQAWVRPARFKGRSIIMEQPTTVALTEADPVRSRIDRVVLRYDAADKKTRLQVLDGTPDSAAPAAPAITRTELIYDLCLAEIKRPAGSTSVTAADIYDTRADETVCGVMRDGVHGIPAATLIKKLRDEIDKVDNGSFYDKTETDALLNALQKQVDSKISSATSITASGNGYIRFADGTQICWLKFNGWSSKGYDPYFPFPVPFANTNYGAGFTLGISITYSSNVECYVFKRTTTGLCVFRSYEGSIVVIGRWK
nr:MAG TPA: Receptor Binding Protein [Caudoviricetes sp.]